MESLGSIIYKCIPYSLVNDSILEKCSKLFNNNYGQWSSKASLHSNNYLKCGSRVQLSVKRLRELILFNDRCFLVLAQIESDQNELIGQAFCTWSRYQRLNGNALWINQLVVHSSYRRRGIAGNLLSIAKNQIEDVMVIGLVSSNPYTVFALSNACNRTPIDLKFVREHGSDLIRVCQIPYLLNCQLVGSVFDNSSPLSTVNDNQQSLSLIKTDFFIEHKELMVILETIGKKWLLGPLLEGHEFVAIFQTTSVRHSKSLTSD